MEKLEISEEDLYQAWIKGKMVIFGRLYNIGKMSYGHYFAEPGNMRGETDGFNNGTLWFEKIPKTDKYLLER